MKQTSNPIKGRLKPEQTLHVTGYTAGKLAHGKFSTFIGQLWWDNATHIIPAAP